MRQTLDLLFVLKTTVGKSCDVQTHSDHVHILDQNTFSCLTCKLVFLYAEGFVMFLYEVQNINIFK